MASEILNLRLTGKRALLLHNGQLADPLNEFTKALKEATSVKKKTEDKLAEIRQLEWIGSLYRDEKGRIAVPEDMILGCFIAGAKKFKLGNEAKAGVLCTEAFHPLKYDGPTDVLELYATGKFIDVRRCVVQRNAVMRTRPRFNKWSVDVALMLDTEIIESKQALQAMDAAGRNIGLGDFRPRFGRFEVQKI
jgi:hypothetical protein